MLIAEREIAKYTGVALYLQHFKAMFIKRIIHTWRNRLVTITQLCVPILFIVFACLSANKFTDPSPDPPPLTLTLAALTEQKVAYVTHKAYSSGKVSSMASSLSSVVSGLATVIDVNQVEPYKSSSDPSLAQYLGDVGINSADDYNRRFMVAADIAGMNSSKLMSSINLTGVFNNQAYHTIAITLGVVDNTLLRYFIDSSYSIETTNHPIPMSAGTKAEEELDISILAAFLLALNLIIGMLDNLH